MIPLSVPQTPQLVTLIRTSSSRGPSSSTFSSLMLRRVTTPSAFSMTAAVICIDGAFASVRKLFRDRLYARKGRADAQEERPIHAAPLARELRVFLHLPIYLSQGKTQPR